MKKVVAFLLCIVLLFACSAVPVCAAEGKLVVLGDSIAAGTGLIKPSTECYSSIAARALGYDYGNFAIAGHTSFDLENRLNNSEVREAVAQADIICVSIGGNNYLGQNIAELIADVSLRNDFTRVNKIAEEFYVSIKRAVKEIKVLNPHALLILQKQYNPYNTALNAAFQSAIDVLNSVFDRIYSEMPGQFVLFDVPAQMNGHPEYVNLDSIHPNKYGHYAIAEGLIELLSDLGYNVNAESVNEGQPIFNKLMAVIRNLFAKIAAFFGGIK